MSVQVLQAPSSHPAMLVVCGAVQVLQHFRSQMQLVWMFSPTALSCTRSGGVMNGRRGVRGGGGEGEGATSACF